MGKIPTARDIMAEFFATLAPETDIYEAIDLLRTKRASGAPVVDANDELLGLLTEKDCLRVMSNDAYQTLARGTVAQYMSNIKTSVEAEMDLFRVAECFLETNFSVLPVMDGERLIGRISRQDMLRGIKKLQRQQSKEKAAEERELQLKTNPAGITQLQRLVGGHRAENVAALFRSMNE